MSQFPPVMLQAGGKGERLMSVSAGLPKVLVPVQGVPLLERLIRQIAREGGRQFHIATGYRSEQVEAHVRGIPDLPDNVRFSFVREHEPRGNVGALTELADLGTTVLFAFGDLFTALSFRRLWEIHLRQRNHVTLTSHFEKHRLQLGHLIVDQDDVTAYREKPEYQFLICSGIAALEPAALQCLPRQGALGMNQMVLTALDHGLQVKHWTHGAFWMDVNTPELLKEANQVNVPFESAREMSNAAG